MNRAIKAQKSTYSDPKTGYTNRILTMTMQLPNFLFTTAIELKAFFSEIIRL